MARTFNGSSQGLRLAFGDLPQPCSIACWFRDTSGSNNDRNLVQICDTASSSANYRMSRSQTAANSIRVFGTFVGTSTVDSTTTYTTNEWNHSIATFDVDDVNIYLNNGGAGNSTASYGSPIPGSIDEISIGLENDASPGDTWLGDIAEVGVWAAELTAESRAMLAAGISPKFVQPEDLVYYAPLVRDLNSIMGENSGVLTDTAANTTVSVHPRIYYPSVKSGFLFSGDAGGISLIADQDEAGDSQVSALNNIIQINSNQAEAGDSQSASIVGVVTSEITANQVEAGDSQTSSISNIVQLNANQSEAGDTQVAALTSVLTSEITASQSEDGDGQSSALSNIIQLSASNAEDGDTQSATLSNVVQLSSNQPEDGDTQLANVLTDTLRELTSNQSEVGDIQAASIVEAPADKTTRKNVKTFSASRNTRISFAPPRPNRVIKA